MMLSNTLVHSSGVKSFLLAMAVSNERSVLARYFCFLITSKFAPEDVIDWCQDEWRAALERAVRAKSALPPAGRMRARSQSYLSPRLVTSKPTMVIFNALSLGDL